jgi:tripartite-type tricarboxylate transporter receptor subunit TctC
MFRNKLIAATAVLVSGLVMVDAALAQNFPSRRITFFVGYAPGGTADTAARLVAEGMKDNLGQAIVIENRPAAGGQVAFEAIKNAPADGYTIGLGTVGLTTLKFFSKDYTIDPLKDFTYLGNGVSSLKGLALVASAGAPYKTLAEFLAYARANPGKVNFGSYGSSGVLEDGSFTHAAGIEVTLVRYNGNSPMETALAAGEVGAAIDSISSAKATLDSGRTRLLAVASRERDADYPNVPTFLEAKVPYEVPNFWLGVIGPAGMPPEVVKRLNEAIYAAGRQPELAKRLVGFAMRPSPSSPDEFRSLVAREDERLTTIAKQIGMKPQ